MLEAYENQRGLTNQDRLKAAAFRELDSRERYEKYVESHVDTIAQVAHAANLRFRLSIGESAGKDWLLMSDDAKNGVRQVIKAKLTKGVHFDPEDLHDGWMASKLRNGWTYGEKEDETAKTHPCLLPFRELTERQRAKDYLFASILQALSLWLAREYQNDIETERKKIAESSPESGMPQ